jgi:hypothetical protein
LSSKICVHLADHKRYTQGFWRITLCKRVLLTSRPKIKIENVFFVKRKVNTINYMWVKQKFIFVIQAEKFETIWKKDFNFHRLG